VFSGVGKYPRKIKEGRVVAKEFCVLSLPRQGTDFFMSCIRSQGSYHREWFNPHPTCNGSFKNTLLPHFGNENEISGLFSRPTQKEFDDILSVWRGLGLNIAKEVWSFAKSDFFASSIHTVYLFRNRRHTFPSSRPDFYEAIWSGFMGASSAKGIMQEVRRYLICRGISDPREKQIVGHSAAWAIQFYFASPQVIYYDKLMELSSDALVPYLQNALPSWVDVNSVSANIESRRTWDKSSREDSYNKFVSGSNAEKEVEMLMGFLSRLGACQIDLINCGLRL